MDLHTLIQAQMELMGNGFTLDYCEIKDDRDWKDINIIKTSGTFFFRSSFLFKHNIIFKSSIHYIFLPFIAFFLKKRDKMKNIFAQTK